MKTQIVRKARLLRVGLIALVALVGFSTIFAPVAKAAEVWQQSAQAPADSAVDPLTASAENGDAAAQLKLGMRYYEGEGRRHPHDYEEALKWFHRAADQGNAEAQARIGMMYHFGRGVPRDEAEAARWYLLAANGGYGWAQLQLSDMYQRGVGVPRDQQEARKWLNLYNAHRPDKSAAHNWELLAIAIFAVLAFSLGLLTLQRRALTGWRSLCIAVLVHAAGIALVLNTLTTYGFGIVFHQCSHTFLATDCTQIADPNMRNLLNKIGDWAVLNLIFRFMAGIGLVLDALAVWYVVYLVRIIFRRSRPRPQQGLSQSPPSVPARNP
ncbi:MAG: tetratricopeptide repeat protein [Candidatus Acidiferrales bacterium]